MAQFKYKAKNVKGETIQGVYSADSQNEVLMMLRQNQNYPINITKVPEKEQGISLKLKVAIETKDIAVFCRQFYTMLRAGVSIVDCLEVLKKQTENKKLRKVLESVHENIQKGMTFSTALRSHEKVFPELLINMIEAGEISGNLDGIMGRMADHYEKESKIQNKVKGAMVYPVMLSIVSVVVVIFLLTFVMPTFLSMFAGSGVELPAPTRMLLFISRTMTQYWFIYTIVLLIVIYGSAAYIHSERGRRVIDGLKLRIPVVKTANQKIITSRFARTLSTLLSSGISLIDALESTAKVIGNKVVEDGITSAINDVAKGIPLAKTINKIGVFPPMVISMIEIGEEAGALDDILDKTANFFDEESEAALQRLTTLVEPLMIIGMSLIIGFIVIAMILPMFDMLNTLNF